ncbi:MAG: potassium transporter TrkG, partial [Bacteroidota bacterium]
STGSGIKQSTFAIFFATIRAAILGRSTVHIFGRRVPKDQILKAIAIISLSLSWVIIVTFLLLLLETGYEFIDILFEVVSSFANLGLSTGITSHLSTYGKSLIIISMIIGRVGSLTLILALMRKHKKREFEYPEERIALS